ncbi:MAG: type II secretion system protein M [Idiomarina sp.]|nr:type II secretion system protein M [Idiomarina sp.]
MKQLFRRFDDWFRSRAKREQWLLSIVMFMVVAWFGFILLVEPTQQRMAEQRAVLDRETTTLATLRQSVRDLEQQLVEDPNALLQQRQRELESQQRRLMRQLDQRAEFVAGDQLAVWMQALLDARSGVVLTEFDTQLPTAFLDRPSQQGTQVYKHPVTVVLEGDYFAIEGYLRELSSLPIAFYWEGFDYQVTRHPTARVTLQIYTLSYEGRGG